MRERVAGRAGRASRATHPYGQMTFEPWSTRRRGAKTVRVTSNRRCVLGAFRLPAFTPPQMTE
jgi:hypothetical protein